MAGGAFIGRAYWRFLLPLLLLTNTASASTIEADAPRRIVSINMCADGLLLALAEPAQIASLSYLSRDPDNANWADAAAAYPSNRGRAEEVLALAPDLVLASRFTTPATLSMLRRLGLPITVLDIPQDFEGIRAQIKHLGGLIHQRDKAEAVMAVVDAELSSLASSNPVASMRALVLQANNIVVGKDTLADSILAEAGLTNIAAKEGISGYGRMSLEAMIKHSPDLIIIDADDMEGPARASQMQRHPALLALIAHGTRVITMPSKLWTCAGPGSVEAVALLRQKAQHTP